MSKSISNPFQQLADSMSDNLAKQISALRKEIKSLQPNPDTKTKKIPVGYLTAAEAADYLKVSEHFIRERKTLGLLAYHQFGRSVRFRHEDLDKLGERVEAQL